MILRSETGQIISCMSLSLAVVMGSYMANMSPCNIIILPIFSYVTTATPAAVLLSVKLAHKVAYIHPTPELT